MSHEWYQKPLRIAALQSNRKGEQGYAVIDAWAGMGFNVEQLNNPSGHGIELADPQKRAQLEAYVAESKRQGLRIILYTNCHTLPTTFGDDSKPEWVQRRRDGSLPLLYDTSYACCVNSPYRDFFFSILDLLAPVDIDGVFLDGPVVIGGGCYCPSCKARYKKLYGAELDSATDTWEFYRRTRDDFLNEGYARFKQGHPGGAFYMNLPVMHAAGSYVSLPEAIAYNDIVGTEGGFMFYEPPKNAYLWKPSAAAKVLEAVAPERPRVIFMAADQKPWSFYMHTPSETKLCIASTVANDANLWYGPHGTLDVLETAGGLAGKEIVQFLARNEAYYDRTTSAARVALMYSMDTERIYRTQTGISDLYGAAQDKAGFAGNFSEAFSGFFDALSRSSVPFDAITDLQLTPDKLARYDCVFLPTSACLSDASLAAIREYVSQGGNIVSSFDTSLYTSQGEQRADFGLSDVFGVSYGAGTIPYKNWNYFSLSGQHPLLQGLDIPYYPAPGFILDVQAHQGAEVLGRFHGIMPGRYAPLPPADRPAIIYNTYGQGHSLYLAGTFAEMCLSYAPVEYRRLLVNAVRAWSQPAAQLEGQFGDVEMTVRRQGERLIVHLVNYAGLLPRPFEKVMPQQGATLRLPSAKGYRQARALYAGQDCTLKQGSDALVVELPELHEYEVVVIE